MNRQKQSYGYESRCKYPAMRDWELRPKSLNKDPEWRCTRCNKLLGVCRDGRMHLRFARGHEYHVGFPAQATCRGCGTLNHAEAPLR